MSQLPFHLLPSAIIASSLFLITDTPTTEIYTLSLHDALPIYLWASGYDVDGTDQTSLGQFSGRVQQTYKHSAPRSEERFSRNAETDLVCRLLLEKKKNNNGRDEDSRYSAQHE